MLNRAESSVQTRNYSREEYRETMIHYGFGVAAAKKIKVCSECGALCKANESFCTECGRGLPEKNLYQQSVEGKLRCLHCGSLLGNAKNYCPVCGVSLETPCEPFLKTKQGGNDNGQ